MRHDGWGCWSHSGYNCSGRPYHVTAVKKKQGLNVLNMYMLTLISVAVF